MCLRIIDTCPLCGNFWSRCVWLCKLRGGVGRMQVVRWEDAGEWGACIACMRGVLGSGTGELWC
jgi:hypothetical protein